MSRTHFLKANPIDNDHAPQPLPVQDPRPSMHRTPGVSDTTGSAGPPEDISKHEDETTVPVGLPEDFAKSDDIIGLDGSPENSGKPEDQVDDTCHQPTELVLHVNPNLHHLPS